jgi:chromate transporter
MNSPSAPVSLIAHIALLAIISFGGVPGVLPDLRDFIVTANGWLTDREFVDCFAIVQAIPGPT